MKTVGDTQEASSMQGLDMAEREPREHTTLGLHGGQRGVRSDSPAMLSVVVGDCRNTLKELASESVQCCVTSPPYWGLRDYGHGNQLGAEATPAEYVANMVAVFAEVWRVLKPDGTLWLNLGDSYASAAPCDRRNLVGNGSPDDKMLRKSRLVGGLKEKDLVGIPWRTALALQAAGWWLRSDIIWAKPNPMPESVTDRPTKSHEYLFLLTKAESYYYDHEAIKEPKAEATIGDSRGNDNGARRDRNYPGAPSNGGTNLGGPDGNRNKRSVWTVPTAPYPGAHFATYPAALITPCILAGTKPGDVVLDPFGGSGTTGATALCLGRRAVLCELNPEYAKLIEERTTTTFGLGL